MWKSMVESQTSKWTCPDEKCLHTISMIQCIWHSKKLKIKRWKSVVATQPYRYRKNLSQHSKGHIWKAMLTSVNEEKKKTFLQRFGKRQGCTLLPIQHNTGSSSQDS